jgi:predicted transcriptional regulator of viral defense system
MNSNKKKKSIYQNERKKVIEYLGDGKLVRWRDLMDLDIKSSTIANMARKEEIVNDNRGLYFIHHDLRKEDSFENEKIYSSDVETFSEVSLRVPKGIICLMSAVSYYEITPDVEPEVWIAIPHSHHKPRVDYPPIRAVHWRNMELDHKEVETIQFKNVPIKITTKERTIVDLYRHQHLLSDPLISKKALSWLLTQNDHNRDALKEISKKFKVYSKIKNDIEAFDNNITNTNNNENHNNNYNEIRP